MGTVKIRVAILEGRHCDLVCLDQRNRGLVLRLPLDASRKQVTSPREKQEENDEECVFCFS